MSGSFSDPALTHHAETETWTATASWSDGQVTPVVVDPSLGTFSTSRPFPDDHPQSGTPFDEFTVQITITDDDLGSDTKTSPILTVHNVDPVIESVVVDARGNRDNPGVPGELISLHGVFSDIGVLDDHTVIVDWGESVIPGDAGDTSDSSDPLDSSIVCNCGAGSFTASHAFGSGGIFTVTVTVMDDDFGEAVASTTDIFVSGARLDPNTDELQVVGTNRKDIVVVNRIGFAGNNHFRFCSPQIMVIANLDLQGSHSDGNHGAQIYLFRPENLRSVRVVLGDGDDHAYVGSVNWWPLGVPTIIEGDGGKDYLMGAFS